MEETLVAKNEVAENKPRNLVFAIGLMVVLTSEFALRDIFLPEHPSDVSIGMALAVEWLILLAFLAFWIPRVEGSTLGSVGLGRLKLRYLWMGLLTYLLLLIAWIANGFALKAIGLEGLRSLQPLIKELSLPTRLSLFLTGTFYEEILYRGYVIERLLMIARRKWIAGLTSWAAFTFVHIRFFGLGPTLDVGVLSAGLVLLYLKERSVWPCVVLHGINDVFGFLIGPLMLT